MGGSNDPSNLIELTIEEHAEAHRILFEKYGKEEDKFAWLGLSKQLSKVEILAEIRKSSDYKQKHKTAVNNPEYKRKMSERFTGEKHPMFGKIHSQTAKEKIKEARKQQTFTKEQIEKRTKKLFKSIQTPDGIFASRKEASEYYNVDPSTINYWLRTKSQEYYYLRMEKNEK